MAVVFSSLAAVVIEAVVSSLVVNVVVFLYCCCFTAKAIINCFLPHTSCGGFKNVTD